MNAKKFLMRVKFFKKDIQRLEMEMEELNSLMTSPKAIRYDKESVQTSAENALENNIIRLDEIGQKLMRLYTLKHQAQAEVQQVIDGLQNEMQKEVLLMHYIDGDSFRMIADFFAYSQDHIYRLHSQGLKEVQVSLDKKERG